MAAVVKQYAATALSAATNNFDRLCFLGSGTFGQVYAGVLDGKAVAIKRMGTAHRTQEMQRERMRDAKLRHDCLLPCLGMADDTFFSYIVYPRMRCDLDQALRPAASPALTAEQLLQIALDCASGLKALEAFNLCHRDLKPPNVLLNADCRAVLADFGTLCLIPDNATHVETPGAAGTPGFRDPMYEQSHMYRPENDIYSLGVLLLCLLTRSPRPGLGQNHLTVRFAAFLADPEGHAPTFVAAADSCLSAAQAALLAGLARECVQPSVDDRPNAAAVAKRLQRGKTAAAGGAGAAASPAGPAAAAAFGAAVLAAAAAAGPAAPGAGAAAAAKPAAAARGAGNGGGAAAAPRAAAVKAEQVPRAEPAKAGGRPAPRVPGTSGGRSTIGAAPKRSALTSPSTEDSEFDGAGCSEEESSEDEEELGNEARRRAARRPAASPRAGNGAAAKRRKRHARHVTFAASSDEDADDSPAPVQPTPRRAAAAPAPSPRRAAAAISPSPRRAAGASAFSPGGRKKRASGDDDKDYSEGDESEEDQVLIPVFSELAPAATRAKRVKSENGAGAARPAAAAPSCPPEERTLHVRGFDGDMLPKVTKAALGKLFGDMCGEVERVDMYSSDDGTNKARILFRDSEGFGWAQRYLKERRDPFVMYDGHSLKVDLL